MTPECADRLGAAHEASRLGGRFVKSDVEGSGIGRKLTRECGFFPRLGRGRFAGRKGVRSAAHGDLSKRKRLSGE